MKFNPEWLTIGHTNTPVSRTVIDEVNSVLFAPDPAPEHLARVDVCLVLGSRNCGYKAERAAELFGHRERVRFVACGANQSDHGVSEAHLITEVLTTHGVAPERIIIEHHSTNTGGNLRHAAKLIRTELGDPLSLNIAVVSSGFHRLHALASLPQELSHARFVSASGPLANKEAWHTNPVGRAVILHELRRPGFEASTALSSPTHDPRAGPRRRTGETVRV